jgi:hypothetical protein
MNRDIVMNGKQFKEFRVATDYLTWERYETQLSQIDFSEVNRERTSVAIAYLRKLFGEDFLREAVENGSSLLPVFINAAPRAKLELVALADSLKRLESVENFHELVSQICDHRASATLPVLQTAARLSRSGFEVSLEPTVAVSSPSGEVREKVPDIRLWAPWTREEFFVEVSRLRKSNQMNKSSNAFMAIWMLADSIGDLVPGGLTDILNPRSMPVYSQCFCAGLH